MPGPYNPEDIRLFVSPTGANGSFVEVLDMTGYDMDRGSDGAIRTRVFGRASEHVRAGSRTSSYTLNGLLNWDDAGQTSLRAAYGDGTSRWLRRLFPDTHRTTQETKVTEAPDSGAADGEWVENAFTLEGVGTMVKDTGGANL